MQVQYTHALAHISLCPTHQLVQFVLNGQVICNTHISRHTPCTDMLSQRKHYRAAVIKQVTVNNGKPIISKPSRSSSSSLVCFCGFFFPKPKFPIALLRISNGFFFLGVRLACVKMSRKVHQKRSKTHIVSTKRCVKIPALYSLHLSDCRHAGPLLLGEYTVMQKYKYLELIRLQHSYVLSCSHGAPDGLLFKFICGDSKFTVVQQELLSFEIWSLLSVGHS